jgi:type VI secretion system protein ImpL
VGKYTPLTRLVNAVKKHSQIYAPVSEDEQAKKALHQDPNRKQAHEISLAFSSLSKLVESGNGKPANLKEVKKSIDAVYETILSIEESASPGNKALQIAKDRLGFRGEDPITVLERVADGLPSPLNTQLTDVAKLSWQVILVSALEEVERKWDAEVYQFFEQRLKYKYPFQKSSRDVSIKDFEAFFGSKGILSSFYSQHLKIFLEDNLDALFSEDQNAYLINTDLIKFLETSWQIEESFFNAQGALHVPYSIEPMTLSGSYRRSVLNVDGQIIPYNHGSTYPIDMVWPNTLRKKAESKLIVINAQGKSQSIKYKGPWSWFRLLQRANKRSQANQSLRLKFSLGGAVMSYTLQPESSNHPFRQNSLRNYQVPQFLLRADERGEEKGAR